MLDFGTPLPFNLTRRPENAAWLAYYGCLVEEQTIARGGCYDYFPERWMYGVWTPKREGDAARTLVAYGTTEQIPYEFLYVVTRREPTYFARDFEVDFELLATVLLASAPLPRWIAEPLSARLSNARRWSRFKRTCFEVH